MKSKIPPFILEGLNEPQRKAVQHVDGPLLVLAGPGSGKTRVVTRRVAALLHQGIGAAQIAALTFTNKAADEMKKRLEQLSPEKHVWIGTFHKFCAYLLRRYISLAGLQENFSIYDTDESLAVIKSIALQKSIPPGITPQRIAAAISWAKNQLVRPENYSVREGSLLGSAVNEFYPAYQSELRRANAVDFDDLLLHTAVLLQDNPEIRQILDNRFRYILVDEYQDTNTVQYVIAKALSMDHRNLAVTGDPDQSIYGWRGANINNILDFEKDFPDTVVVRLEENYRSTPQILAAADSVIANNIYRKEKILVTKNADGSPVRLVKCADQRAEAEYIAQEIGKELQSGLRKPGDYAVFYRMNALSRNFEHAFRSRKIPFQLIRGLEFFNRKEVKDVLAYLRVVFNPADTMSLMRIINEPVRGIGKTTMTKLSSHALNIGVPTMDVMRGIGSFSGIAAKTKKAVMQFVQMIDRLSALSAQEYPVAALIETVLRESNYRNQFVHSESEEDLERLANIDELLTVAHEFDEAAKGTEHPSAGGMLPDNTSPLEEFLEQAALVSDTDTRDDGQDRVSLMTLHAAKGLEFPVVYITAIEEGILPHERSQADAMQLEEERRLFFVGITRAEEELRLSRAERRDFRGSSSVTAIFSRFLTELPNDGNVVKYGSPDDFLNGEDYGGGVRLVREKTAEYHGEESEREYAGDNDDIHAEDVHVDIDGDIDVERDIEYDVEYDEEFAPQKEQKHHNKKHRPPIKTGLSLMTGSELLKRKKM